MNGYKRSICSTCRYVTHCVITTNKNTINSCSEYVHLFEDEPMINAILVQKKQVPKRVIQKRRPKKVLF